MSQPYLGQIETFAFGYAPRGWLQCSGQLLPIAQNQALFSLLGTSYGGDGIRTFGLPDLRGRISAGFSSTYPIGTRLGEENHTLLATEMPSHTHTVSARNNGMTGGTTIPDATMFPASASLSNAAVNEYSSNAGTIPLAPTASVGGNQPHANMMPYNTLSYCISTSGIFPSRN